MSSDFAIQDSGHGITVLYYNNVRKQRFEFYYPYLKDSAEFQYHKDEKVLEVGVGMGTDIIEYARYGAKVYGIDLETRTPQIYRI